MYILKISMIPAKMEALQLALKKVENEKILLDITALELNKIKWACEILYLHRVG